MSVRVFCNNNSCPYHKLGECKASALTMNMSEMRLNIIVLVSIFIRLFLGG